MVAKDNQANTNKKVGDWQDMSLPTMDEQPVTDLRELKRESRSVFVEVQNLTKGQTFVSEYCSYLYRKCYFIFI